MLDVVHASATIGRADHTFGFSKIEYSESLEDYLGPAKAEVNRVRANAGLELGVAGNEVIHFSSLPWISFTSLSHARKYDGSDSCPKVSCGKLSHVDGRYTMPLSIHVHQL